MHKLHYKNLPFALGVYCQQPQHRYSTRYSAALNYVIPPVSTDRTKGSIKFAGPKAWAEVPINIKEVAFRKPFSKKMKNHILNSIFVEEHPTPIPEYNDDNLEYRELEALFQIDDEELVFEGFDTPDLEEIFQTEDEESDFEGFNILDLNQLFLSDGENEEFLGF